MPADSPVASVSEARVRRVPKYGVFLVLGGALGVLAATILTFVFDGVMEPSDIGVTYSRGQVFGFLLLFCLAGGVALGAVVALILDRTVGRKTRAVLVQHETIIAED